MLADLARRFVGVSTAPEAVETLVARVRESVAADDPAATRDALEQVLRELGVSPGDPAWTNGRDIVGDAYERLVAGSDRRAHGQFFTPLPVGRAMASWLLTTNPRLLMDPG